MFWLYENEDRAPDERRVLIETQTADDKFRIIVKHSGQPYIQDFYTERALDRAVDMFKAACITGGYVETMTGTTPNPVTFEWIDDLRRTTI